MIKIFKDTNNKVHEIEEGFEHLLPVGAVEITQAEADALRAPTAAEIEAKRKSDITDKANSHILSKYSELKQRKYLSIVAALDDKELRQSVVLTDAELALLQEVRDVNEWITSVRVIENAAIADGATLAENMVLPV